MITNMHYGKVNVQTAVRKVNCLCERYTKNNGVLIAGINIKKTKCLPYNMHLSFSVRSAHIF